MGEVDVDLDVRSGTHAEQTAKILLGLEKVVSEMKPSVVVAQGDTNTVLATALAAVKSGVLFAHVEAGLRSWNFTMPEEVNRRVADAVAQLHFAPTRLAALNLAFEGISWRSIRLVGNTIVDVVLKYAEKARERGKRVLGELGIKPQEYVLVTVHRAENTDTVKRLSSIVKALIELSKSVDVVFPVHPRTAGRLKQYGLWEKLHSAGIRLLPPLGYFEFLGLLSYSKVVLTDSGGVQEEAYVLKVPTVTLRYNTERPETVIHGVNVLAGTQVEEIITLTEAQMKRYEELQKSTLPNVFGDGRAGERIAKALKEFLEVGIGIKEPDMRSCVTLNYQLATPQEAGSALDAEVLVTFDNNGVPHLPSEESVVALIRRCFNKSLKPATATDGVGK